MDCADLGAVGKGVRVGWEGCLLEGVHDVLDNQIGPYGIDETLLAHTDIIAAIIGPPAHDLDDLQPDAVPLLPVTGAPVLLLKPLDILQQIPDLLPERHDTVDKVIELLPGDVGLGHGVVVGVVELVVELTLRVELLYTVLYDRLIELTRHEEVAAVAGQFQVADEGCLRDVGLGDRHLLLAQLGKRVVGRGGQQAGETGQVQLAVGAAVDHEVALVVAH